jgi:hypothetical protein
MEDILICQDTWEGSLKVVYTVVSSCAQFLLPVILVIPLYLSIYIKLKNRPLVSRIIITHSSLQVYRASRQLSCSSALPSARQQSVFAYPKQRATVLVGSVLKWRARPQCLCRQKSVFAYPKQRATVSVGSVLKWRARPQCLRRRRDFVLQMNKTYICNQSFSDVRVRVRRQVRVRKFRTLKTLRTRTQRVFCIRIYTVKKSTFHKKIPKYQFFLS